MSAIPIRDVTPATAEHAPHYDAPYRQFIAASLTMGIGGGFLLSLLLPLARTLDWRWGATERWAVLVQIHGQLQLIGFGGLFVMGMALRLIPRVSGRPLATQWLIPVLIPCMVGYLLLRSFAQPLGDGTLRDAALIASAALLLAGSVSFATIVWGTLVHRDSKAEATGWFFTLGAAALVATSVLNAVQTSEIVRHSLATAPGTRQSALIFTQQFGFLIMFVAGVGSRAIPTLTGQPRRQLAPRFAAIIFATGIALFATFVLIAAERRAGDTLIRMGASGLFLTGIGFTMFVWISGALSPGSRVAAASKTQFLFVRCAFAWMAVAAILTYWYAGRALLDATTPNQFELDAIRHILTIGVLINMVIGMAMLIVPEFAGRRLQHPNERLLQIAILLAVNIASALRLWPAFEGLRWLEDTRYWPIAASGSLASIAVVAFGLMFAQSWWEQRDPSWAARAAGVATKVG